jgi:hypothetical protein
LLEFLTEANLLPPAAYLQLQNRDMDGNSSESDTLISLGLIDATSLAHLQTERLGEGYIDLTYFPPNPDLLKILGPANALQMGVLPWRLSADVTIILTDRPNHLMKTNPICAKYLAHCAAPLPARIKWDPTSPPPKKRRLSIGPNTALPRVKAPTI